MELISKSQTRRILSEELPKLVGLTVAEGAVLIAKNQHSFKLRIVQEDDISYVSTCEFRPDRINVIVKNGIIIEILGIG